MDGNGRWARKRDLPRTFGHEAGLKKVREITEECGRLGIPYLTLFAFSTENWKRPAQEVSYLMNLFYQSLQQVTAELHSQRVRIRFLGMIDGLPAKLRTMVKEVEAQTAANRGLNLNLAINYGGRSELVQAVRQLVKEAQEQSFAPEEITEERLAGYLFTAGQPDPDLLIRTSGEQRISNFLLWQTAYTEFYFTDTLWPDFGPAEFREALLAYKKRSRRFGGIKEGRVK
ncbi:MAG: isoprenyl transferase [Firmicutes bacterium]|nr:isoprenyl transferase [Bacillota bacterium]